MRFTITNTNIKRVIIKKNPNASTNTNTNTNTNTA